MFQKFRVNLADFLSINKLPPHATSLLRNWNIFSVYLKTSFNDTTNQKQDSSRAVLGIKPTLNDHINVSIKGLKVTR